MKSARLRAEADIRNEKINYKVCQHSVGNCTKLIQIASGGYL
jgi:hypothetical protein